MGETPGEAGGGEPLTAEIYLDFNVVGSMEVLTPAVLLALPGLLIAASLVAQLAGGIPWIPLTRRFIGGPQAPASGSRRPHSRLTGARPGPTRRSRRRASSSRR